MTALFAPFWLRSQVCKTGSKQSCTGKVVEVWQESLYLHPFLQKSQRKRTISQLCVQIRTGCRRTARQFLKPRMDSVQHSRDVSECIRANNWLLMFTDGLHTVFSYFCPVRRSPALPAVDGERLVRGSAGLGVQSSLAHDANGSVRPPHLSALPDPGAIVHVTPAPGGQVSEARGPEIPHVRQQN